MKYLSAALILLSAGSAMAEPLFINRAAELPVQHVYAGEWEHFVGGGVAILDCNGDQRPDIFAAGGSNPATLLINQGEFTFAKGALPEILETTGAYPLDIDGDGWMDLAVLRVGANQLLRGGPDCAFTEATKSWGFAPGTAWSTAFSATWEPGQDWPTLAVGNYVDRARPDGPFEVCDDNLLFRPKPGGGYGIPEKITPGFCALSMLFSDWKRTGTPDLRISNDRQYYVRGGYEEMWHLNPLAPYAAEDWPRISLWGMGIASRDITGDGLPEVMLTSMGDQLLQINTGTGLTNAPFGIGTYAHRPFIGDDGRPSTGWHAEFGDIDNDGRDDLFIAKGNVEQMPSNAIHDPNNLLMQGADGVFVEKADVAGIATLERSRGAGLADFDGDGRLDIIVINRRAPLELWQNVTPESGAWAAVELRQAQGNLHAVGAWVEVRADGKTWAQEVTVGGGHVSGQSGPLHFGLGNATKAEIRVIWPHGSQSDWQALPLNRRIRVSATGSALTID